MSARLRGPARLPGGLPGSLRPASSPRSATPLLSGPALRLTTVVSVLLLAAASLAHAGSVFGRGGFGSLLLVAGGLGLLAETVGVHTGYPFGEYAYSGGLGPKLAGVPLVVPLAWTMLAYPVLLLGRSLFSTRFTVALGGGLALASWDLFLDPQMVSEGNWTWAHPAPALPGVPGVPLTNYAGWVLVAVVMVAVLDRVLPRTPADVSPGLPVAVLTWTWLGSVVGNLVFFDRPWVALYGGLAMGAFVLPYLVGQLNLRSRE